LIIKPGDIGSTGIVHTRWATQGDPSFNGNNHPIDVAGIVGVHNGHCSNDRALFARIESDAYERQAEVDSEAIFAWLAHGDQKASIVQRMTEIRGNASLLWLESSDQRQRLHCARLTVSPLVMGQMKGGSLIVASTKAILDETAKRLNIRFEFIHEFAEGEYAIIENGRLAEWIDVPMPKPLNVGALPMYGGSSQFEKGGK